MTSAQYERLMRILVRNGCLAKGLQFQLTPGTTANGTADYAGGILTTAVDCLMVGMEREALDLLAKANEWMTAALGSAAEARRSSWNTTRSSTYLCAGGSSARRPRRTTSPVGSNCSECPG